MDISSLGSIGGFLKGLFVYTHRIDFQVPLFSRALEVDDYFFVGQVEFFEGDMDAMGPWTAVVGVYRRQSILTCRYISE